VRYVTSRRTARRPTTNLRRTVDRPRDNTSSAATGGEGERDDGGWIEAGPAAAAGVRGTATDLRRGGGVCSPSETCGPLRGRAGPPQRRRRGPATPSRRLVDYARRRRPTTTTNGRLIISTERPGLMRSLADWPRPVGARQGGGARRNDSSIGT